MVLQQPACFWRADTGEVRRWHARSYAGGDNGLAKRRARCPRLRGTRQNRRHRPAHEHHRHGFVRPGAAPVDDLVSTVDWRSSRSGKISVDCAGRAGGTAMALHSHASRAERIGSVAHREHRILGADSSLESPTRAKPDTRHGLRGRFREYRGIRPRHSARAARAR